MYSVHKQIHAPTGIEHCVYCNFFNSWEKNLVIAGVNQLHVYRLNSEPDMNEIQEEDKTPENRKTRLENLATFSLFGNVMSMQSVKLAGSQRDALLLSFSDAKLSVLEYDPGTHDLKTSSLHQFEELELKEGFYCPYSIPMVRVDPDGRCAVMLVYGTHLVVLPFRRDAVLEDIDPVLGGSFTSKSPILQSYIIDLRKLDEKISNVHDIQFLHGYFEPTVFILYEPLMTWTGRTAVRADTCSIAAISLNIQQKVHPIIWSLSNLPFDCFMAVAVPRPIGGVIVFAVNSLLYLNQSVPPYGVSLNVVAETSSAFPLRRQDVKITLDMTRATLISHDRLVLSLKGGELYVLTLVVDGMRSVRSFHFDKAASSVLTTCMCMCEEGFLFLGSRLGNSLLLKYEEKALDKTDKQAEDKKQENAYKFPKEDVYSIDLKPLQPQNEPAAKKRKVEGADQLASDVTEIENLDELEVYGASENTAGTTITSYTFEVCDNIWNIAPCGQITMGDPVFLSEEFSNSLDPDLELVTTSGYGKNGALSVLQRSIRPQVVTTFELPGCRDMWTVFSSVPVIDDDAEKEEGEKEEEPKPEMKGGHAFLILTRADTSMVLKTGQEIMELDHSGFSTEAATVYAGNIGANYILQVCSKAIRLLEGVKQLQHIPMDICIIKCTVADPYVLIMTEDGGFMLLTLKQDSFGTGVRLAVMKPQIQTQPLVVSIAAYKDLSGMLTTSPLRNDDQQAEKISKPVVEKPVLLDSSAIDDEDELLYGDSDTSAFTSSFNVSMQEEPKTKTTNQTKKDLKPTYWAVMCRENGDMEIYSVPDFKMCFYVKNFPMGHKVLVDSGQIIDTSVKPSTSFTGEKAGNLGEVHEVKELLMVGLGHNKSRPYLLENAYKSPKEDVYSIDLKPLQARVEDSLLIYEAFPYQQENLPRTENHLKIRFKRYNHNILLKEKRPPKGKKKDDKEEEEKVAVYSNQQLRYFEDISGYSGVFICGPYPFWLFMTSKGSLRIHPMSIDGAVTSFTPFHNINCPKGFLYFNKQSELRISVLPTHVTYDAPWPIRKVPLRCTPLHLTYHSDSKMYAVVTKTPELCNMLPRNTSDEREWDTVGKDERFIYPTMDRYNLQLFTPSSWELIPRACYETEEWEDVTVLKNVMLKSEGTLSGIKGYIAMGTNYSLGEEVVSRGRLIIFEVIEVVPEPGQPLTKTRIKIIYEREQKGPVTCLAHVNGFLLSAIGQKLYMWTLKDNDLIGVAFIDTHIFIHSLSVMKNLILAGDLLKSISLYRFQDNLKVLSIVSRDIKPLEVYAIDFMVDNTQINFAVSDRNKNIILYTYQPEARESHGGQRLLRRADFNIGSHINSMFRVRCRLTDIASDKKLLAMYEKRHITYFATLDGSLGYLMPISEKVYRRLLMLQNAMTTHVPHTAGLNPKAYRAVILSTPELANPHKNILDGELLWKYLHLSVLEKNEISKRIGTSTEQIMDDLMEIDRVTAHF